MGLGNKFGITRCCCNHFCPCADAFFLPNGKHSFDFNFSNDSHLFYDMRYLLNVEVGEITAQLWSGDVEDSECQAEGLIQFQLDQCIRGFFSQQFILRYSSGGGFVCPFDRGVFGNGSAEEPFPTSCASVGLQFQGTGWWLQTIPHLTPAGDYNITIQMPTILEQDLYFFSLDGEIRDVDQNDFDMWGRYAPAVRTDIGSGETGALIAYPNCLDPLVYHGFLCDHPIEFASVGFPEGRMKLQGTLRLPTTDETGGHYGDFTCHYDFSIEFLGGRISRLNYHQPNFAAYHGH